MHRFLVLLLLLLCPALFGQPPELVSKSQRGKQLMGAGQFVEAAVVYQDLINILPNNPGLMLNLGMALHMAGQDRQAIPQFEKALQLQPGILPALMFLGASRLAVGEPAKAIQPLREVVTAQPQMKEARQLLGDALAATGQLDEAAGQYRHWTSLDGSNPRAWFALGTTYESLSLRAFEALEKSHPESAYMLVLVGEVRLTQRQYGSAFFLYRTALERQPRLPGAHAALAEIYRQTSHPDWAATEDAKERALPAPDCQTHKLECDFRESRFLSVIAAVWQDNTAESLYWSSQAHNRLARQVFDQLAQLPASVERHEFQARLHRNQGRHIEAVKSWRAALKLSPGNPDLERELAVSLHQSRDNKSALPIFERLVKKAPGSADLNFMLGDTLLSLQQAERAVPYLRNAVNLAPKLLAARSSLGRALLQLNQGAEAIPHLEVALPTDGDGTLHFQLARAYQLSGQSETAKKALAKYQEMRDADAAERRRLEEEMTITAP